MRVLRVLVLCAACVAPATLHAQETPHEIRRRNDCRLAEQVIRTGHPAPHLRRAYERARYCPNIGRAVAEAMNRSRTSNDTALLNAITSPMMNLRDGRVYETAMAVARDRSASVPARVFAIRALVWLLRPGVVIEYADLTDEPGDPEPRACIRSGTPLHLRLSRGEPIPENYVEAIHRFGSDTQADPSEPRAIKRAAVCATFPPIDVSRR
jgi:hypothetical protein